MKLKHLHHLIYSPPILLAILQHPFPHHTHHFREMLVGERILRNFMHDSSMWTPRIVIGGFTHSSFNFRVIHHHICPVKSTTIWDTHPVHPLCCSFCPLSHPFWRPWSWIHIYTVWVKKIYPPPWGFLKFFPNDWEFLIKILQACYSFILTLNCKILFNLFI